MTNAAPIATSTTVMTSCHRPRISSARASLRRIRGVHDGRDLVMELLEPTAEREPLRRLELVGGDQHPRAVDLDGCEPRRFEQPLHQLTVEQRERELPVRALHAESAVEVGVFELDVVQTEMVAEP